MQRHGGTRDVFKKLRLQQNKFPLSRPPRKAREDEAWCRGVSTLGSVSQKKEQGVYSDTPSEKHPPSTLSMHRPQTRNVFQPSSPRSSTASDLLPSLGLQEGGVVERQEVDPLVERKGVVLVQVGLAKPSCIALSLAGSISFKRETGARQRRGQASHDQGIYTPSRLAGSNTKDTHTSIVHQALATTPTRQKVCRPER